MHDFFLLQKQDLLEMGFPIGIRNRIISFIDYYKRKAGDFDLTNFSLTLLLNESIKFQSPLRDDS
jgi:hypothetical protein